MTTEHEGATPLDRNLERLLKVAPKREGLSEEAKISLAARLRERARSHSTPGAGTEAPEPMRHSADADRAPSRRAWRSRAAVAAAAAILLFLGIQAVQNATTGGSPGDPDRIVGTDGPGRDPEVRPLDPGDDGASPDGERMARGPGRSAMGVSPGDMDEDPVASEGPAPPDALAVSGSIRLDESMAAAPVRATVWVRPLLPLPRVADAERYDLAWEGARALPFVLEGALESAREMGARRVLVHVEAAGAGSASTVQALPDEDQVAGLQGIELTLFGEETATGYVVDQESGTGVPGAVVIAVDQIPLDALDVHPEKQGDLPTPHAIADAAGKFTLRGLRRAASVRLRASAPGYAPGWQTINAARGTGDSTAPRFNGTIELGSGGRVFGVVERENGTRWEGAAVIVSRQDFAPFTLTRPVLTYGSALTDADGRFEVEDLPSGMYVTLLMGDMRGGSSAAPRAFELTRVTAGAGTEINFISVQASAGGALRGVLRSAEGATLGGRSLTISSTAAMSQEDSGWRATTTTDDGSFTFPDLDPGEYSLMHNLGGFAEMAAIWSGRIDGPTELDLTLPGGAALLRGIDGGGSQGSGAWAMVERLDRDTGAWNFAGSGVATSGHEVQIRHLLPGRYRATYLSDAPESAFAASAPFEVLGARVEVPIQVTPGDTLTVRAVGAGGDAAPDVTVEIWPGAGSSWAGRRLPQRAPAVTGPDGLVQLQGVPFGELELRLRLGERPAGSLRFDHRSDGPGREVEPVNVPVVVR